MSFAAGLLGGTGLVGASLLDRLVADPDVQRIDSYARRATRLDVKIVTHALPDPGQAPDLAPLEGGAFFCCIGTTIAKAGSKDAFRAVDLDLPLRFAAAARKAGVRSFVVVSSLGADARSPVFYSRVKGELEDGLRALGFDSLVILRPSLLLGDRPETRLGEALAARVLGVARPALRGPLRKYRAIAAATVARAMLRAAKAQPLGVTVLESDAIERTADG